MFIIRPSSIKHLLQQCRPLRAEQIQRTLFGILRIAFNKVDEHRLKVVGPDRLCAEWILKNGGMVRFTGRTQITDYNALPSSDQRVFIQEVDATGASIMAIGFDHFKNCTKIEKIILHKCKHMENEALEKLTHVKDSLQFLQISECYNVVDSGLLSLTPLANLRKLILCDLPYVKDMSSIERELRSKLVNCEMDVTSQPN